LIGFVVAVSKLSVLALDTPQLGALSLAVPLQTPVWHLYQVAFIHLTLSGLSQQLRDIFERNSVFIENGETYVFMATLTILRLYSLNIKSLQNLIVAYMKFIKAALSRH
jgi:hypothetical protein